MGSANILIQLDDKEDSKYFETITCDHRRLETRSPQSISAVEIAVGLLISIGTSATYDLLKGSGGVLHKSLKNYLESRAKKKITIIVNGIKYKIESDEDIERLVADIHEIVEDK